jgi:hypothetical protein
VRSGVLGTIFSGCCAVLMAWAVYAIVSWGLSFTAITAVHRAAMSAIAGILFVAEIWLAGISIMLRKE